MKTEINTLKVFNHLYTAEKVCKGQNLSDKSDAIAKRDSSTENKIISLARQVPL